MANWRLLLTSIGLLWLLAPLDSALATPAKPQVVMAVADWAPYTIGKSAPFSGIDIDIARLIAKELGFELRLRHCAFKRCLEEMRNGAIDLQSGIAFNEDRAEYLDYIEPHYGQVRVVFYVLKGRADRLVNYADLSSMSIGYVTGSHYFEPFNSDASLNKEGVYRESMLLRMLGRGRIDTMIGTNPNLDYEVLQAGMKGQFEAARYDPQERVNLYFAISRKSPLLRRKAEIGALLEQYEQQGVLEQISSRYR